MSQAQGRREGGFSLIEVLIAMVILAGLAGSVFHFLTSQNTMGIRSGDLLRGINLGKMAMDSLKVAEYDMLEAGSDTVSDRFIRSWHITRGEDEEENPTGRKRITLTVLWPLTAAHSVSLSSLMSDPRFKEGK